MSTKHSFIPKMKSFLSIILGLVAVVLVSAIVVWPLWYFSTHFTSAYSIIVICGIVIFIFVSFFRYFKQKASDKKS